MAIIIPVVVAILSRVKLQDFGIEVEPFSFLPPIYASINALTAIVLIWAVIAIKNKNRNLHERLMKLAILLSLSFLVMYVAYHMTSDSTKFGGEGVIKYIYYFIKKYLGEPLEEFTTKIRNQDVLSPQTIELKLHCDRDLDMTP